MLAALIGESVVLLLVVVLVVGLLRSHASILRILHEAGLDTDSAPPAEAQPRLLQIGSDALGRDVAGLSVAGDALSFGVIGVDGDTLLAFLSTTCHTCAPFWEAFRAVVVVPGGARLIVVVVEEDSTDRLAQLAGSDLAVVRSDAAWRDYEVPGSPHFVYVEGQTGRIVGQGTAATWPQVFDLMQQALGPGATRSAAADRDNAERIDAELAAAGIGPGHPSLFPATTRRRD